METSSTKTKEELIISAFEKMDISLLEILLDDSKTYQNATKEVFLEKLNGVFDTFKKENDTALISHKGECEGKGCNAGCKGYCFVGNNSGKSISFIFEEKEKTIKDIYRCREFKTDERKNKLNVSIPFEIEKDEEADFIPDIEYQNYFRRSQQGYREMIINNEVAYLSKEDYLPWLEKYADIFEWLTADFFVSYGKFKKFESLYNDLKHFSDYLINENDAANALKDYDLFNHKDEKLLLEWLVKQEQLNENLGGFIDFMWYEEEAKKGYVPLSTDNNLKILLHDFKNIIQFKTIRDTHFEEMHKKYATITESNLEKLEYYSEEKKNYFSLKYHLKKRGMIDKFGNVELKEIVPLRANLGLQLKLNLEYNSKNNNFY